MVRCPHCHIDTIPIWRKFWPSGQSFECPECGRAVGISAWVYGSTSILLFGMLVVSWFTTAPGWKWGLIGGAALAAIVCAWMAPLARR